ncbi:MAG TPA: hypothetical protein PK006_03695 [Saprospiraceae bacterium]|nr:hypothetical protein [Saprospiraceae bacterium]
MIYWLKIIVSFCISCFFILPFFNVEDPFRAFALRFFYKESTAQIYEHECNPDRIYRYVYQLGGKEYQQRYNGFVEALDQLIPEQERCKLQVPSKPVVAIKYFPYFQYWSEPLQAERLDLWLFLGVNLIKIFAVLILITIFVRK